LPKMLKLIQGPVVAIYFQDGTNETHTGRRWAIARIEKREERKRDLMLVISMFPDQGWALDPEVLVRIAVLRIGSSPVELDVVIHNGVTLEVSWGLSGLKKHRLKTVSPKQSKASKWNNDGQWNTSSPACCSRWSGRTHGRRWWQMWNEAEPVRR